MFIVVVVVVISVLVFDRAAINAMKGKQIKRDSIFIEPFLFKQFKHKQTIKQTNKYVVNKGKKITLVI